jgi:outer membrane protein OmpA-like peptidoglycan-associated protein
MLCVALMLLCSSVAMAQVTAGDLAQNFDSSYALLIGVSRYTNGWDQLPQVTDGLGELKDVLEIQGFSVTVLENSTNAELGNGESIRQSIRSFINRYGLRPQNRVLIFFGGHGDTTFDRDSRTRKGYLVPADAPLPTEDLDGFLAAAVGMDEIRAQASRIKAKHALLVFDACFAGSIFTTYRSSPPIAPSITTALAKSITMVITAGDDRQKVEGESTFLKVLVDGLRGGADLDQDKLISGSELGMYLKNRVKASTDQNAQVRPLGIYGRDEGDFVFEVPSDAISGPEHLSILFDSESNKLSAEMIDRLRPTLELLRNDTALRVNITGYGANSGEPEDDWKISFDRANAVYSYLREQGIAPRRIYMSGAGALGSLDELEKRKRNYLRADLHCYNPNPPRPPKPFIELPASQTRTVAFDEPGYMLWLKLAPGQNYKPEKREVKLAYYIPGNPKIHNEDDPQLYVEEWFGVDDPRVVATSASRKFVISPQPPPRMGNDKTTVTEISVRVSLLPE